MSERTTTTDLKEIEAVILEVGWENLPDPDLLVVGHAADRLRKSAGSLYARAKGEAERRMGPTGARRIATGEGHIERKTAFEYQPDVDRISTLLADLPGPWNDHLTFVPEKVIPARLEVKNTNSLLAFIKSLGDTPLALELQDAMGKRPKPADFAFVVVDPETGEKL